VFGNKPVQKELMISIVKLLGIVFQLEKKGRGFKSSNLIRRALTGVSTVWRKLGGGLLGKLSIVSIIGEYLLYSCLVYM
jgi:hypothetical protein